MLSLVLYPGEPGDRHASMPRLRIQFHRDLSQGRTGGGGQRPPCCLRPLPRDSLVDAGRVGTRRAETEPLPGSSCLSLILFWRRQVAAERVDYDFPLPVDFLQDVQELPLVLGGVAFGVNVRH